jgi:hypothetical protein
LSTALRLIVSTTIKRVTDKRHQYSFYTVTATMAVAAVPPLPGLLFFFFFFSLLRMVAAVI